MHAIVDIIQKKRDGAELSPTEIGFLVEGFMSGLVPDYQMSAWLMAVVLRGLTFAETLALTDSMVDSGARLDVTGLGRPLLDKHSTGGVGDKVTLVLGPVVAACDGVFGKMSGRGLGHTGGTVDKLESISGYRTDLDPEDFLDLLKHTGICVIGQTASLAPADKKLYELRDVTGTIESHPLVAASIMSKKIAAGASAVVLDVKVGRGSFAKTRGHASGVAHLMEEIGKARGIKVETVLTVMDQPLGTAVGNALEVNEAVEALKGNGAADLVEVVIELARRLLAMSDLGWDLNEASTAAQRALSNGSGLAKFREWIASQGGDASFMEDPGVLPVAEVQAAVVSPQDGYVKSLDALVVGRAVQELGAGRKRREDVIDHGVGVVLHAKAGARVRKDDRVATVFARSSHAAETAAAAMAGAYRIGTEPVQPPAAVLR